MSTRSTKFHSASSRFRDWKTPQPQMSWNSEYIVSSDIFKMFEKPNGRIKGN